MGFKKYMYKTSPQIAKAYKLKVKRERDFPGELPKVCILV